ncbi:MAG: hypothetical protein JW995_04015 [Melioribacteraceae bacterium]|nr:hypothetical protein [Melioribacteraceae bacterium]
MKIAIVQFSPEWENPEGSIAKLSNIIPESVDADLMVFPEMSLTGFTMNTARFGEEIDGLSTRYFINLSSRLKIHIIAGVIEKYNNKYYNNSVHFDKNGLISARYRKIHPFSPGKEDKYFSPSSEPVASKIENQLFGLSVCYDLRFPELYRLYGKRKVGAIINIANWPKPRIEHWTHLLKARAIENQCFMIGCNRVGNDPEHSYPGKSAVYDPMGNEIMVCDDKEGIYNCELNFNDVEEVREKLNFLDDIRLI